MVINIKRVGNLVKGVNKTVIEVNNTGSRLFEKIVFYVTPEYGTLSAKQLRRAARNFSFNFEDTGSGTLRKRVRNKRKIKAAVFLGVAAVILAVALILVL